MFSFIVPCHNVAPFLDSCIASLLAQPVGDWECLLYVEESGDGTLEIARGWAEEDARFRVFEGPRTGSCSVPRNRGVEEARGGYVVFLDGDDTLAPGSLARLRDAIAARPGADLYPCAIQVRDAQRRRCAGRARYFALEAYLERQDRLLRGILDGPRKRHLISGAAHPADPGNPAGTAAAARPSRSPRPPRP